MDVVAVIVILLGAMAAAAACRDLDSREQRYAITAYVVHVAASFAHWAIETLYYGVSDAITYMESGAALARLMDADLFHFGPEVVKLALHIENALPFGWADDGTGTGTMAALAGMSIYLVGPSLLNVSLLTSCCSWFGQLCLYRVARRELPVGDRGAALVGCLCVPSVIYWGAGFAKESFVLGFFGILWLSTCILWRAHKPIYLLGIAIGGVGVAMLKPYTLLPYVLGVAAFLYADRAWRAGRAIQLRPGYLVLAIAVATAGTAGMGALFPQFGADQVVETISTQQELWQQTDGGSNIDMGSGDAHSMSQQLAFAPLAVVNAFFRPAIFEAHNGPAFGAAVETTLLALAVLSVLLPGRRAVAQREFFRSPFLVFSGVFVLVFGMAVGLATSNLGSLSRYRVPMMPFYATTLLVLRRRIKEAKAASEAIPRAALLGARSRPA